MDQYFNYKKTHSINLLAVSDANYCFTLVHIGTQGRQSDGGIFVNSKFGQRFEKNEMDLPQQSAVDLNGSLLPYVLVTDEAFALKQYDATISLMWQIESAKKGIHIFILHFLSE